MFLHAARQPILDREQNLYAYELLFRNGEDDFFAGEDGHSTTSSLIAASQFELSLSDLTGGKPAHINFNLKSILKQHPTMIPANEVVIEVVDIKKPGKRLLEECKALKAAGYCLLLDNYSHQNVWIHIFPFIGMIKLDLQTATTADIQRVAKIKKKFNHIKLVGGKIQTKAEFKLALDAGFDYFQGYFFAKPQIIKEKSITNNDYSLAELLFEISSSELNLQKIISTFQSDVSLTYKLLRYSNSAIFKRQVEISSIKQAIISLGKTELSKFVTLLFAAQSTKGKPSELLAVSLVRAKFCEELALTLGTDLDSSIAFLTGMFSLIDVMLDEPMQDIIDKLKLSSDVGAALLEKQGKLAQLIDIAVAYEQGDWSQIEKLSILLSLELEDVAAGYRCALSWCDEQMSFIA